MLKEKAIFRLNNDRVGLKPSINIEEAKEK
jgi:hypothetical protein